MKKLILSLLFLFPVITHSAEMQSTIRVDYGYLTIDRRLTDEEKKIFLGNKNTLIKNVDLQDSFVTLDTLKNASPTEDGPFSFIPIYLEEALAGIMLLAKDSKDPKAITIEGIEIFLNHKNKKVGTVVIDSIFTELQPSQIKLFSHPNATGFYKKLGFTEEPTDSNNFYKKNPYLTEQS